MRIDFDNPLGFGTDGYVWKTDRPSALKALEWEKGYRREQQAYLRLRINDITEIDGFAIPRLIDYSDRLLTVEIGIVSPPFILDFAKAYLDRPPEFSPEVMEDWEAERVEWFGEERWPIVRSALWKLEKYGIYYQDARPANISFAD